MTSLNEVKGMNQYCGPAVLAILTGRSTDDCARVISQISGKKEIKAVDVNHILQAFDRLGFTQKPVPLYSSTLYGVLTQLAKQNGNYLVLVPRHVVMIQIKDGDILFCDNHTKHPINAAASARLSQRVENVWLISERQKAPIPRVIRTEIRLDRGAGFITVARWDVFDNGTEAKRHISKGSIFYESEEDLEELVSVLMGAAKKEI